MNVVLTVAEIVAPVCILASVGFGWVKLGFEYPLRFVTQLAMGLGMPCLVFTALMLSDIERGNAAILMVAAVLCYLAVIAIFFSICLLGKLNRQTFLAPLTFGNTGNLGLPLALFAFGETGLGFGVIVFAVSATLTFTLGVWFVSGAGSFGRVLREPIAISTVLGTLFLWQGWETPTFITNALSLIGQLTIPLMLITLGVALARLTAQNLGRAAVLSAIKVLVCVGVAWPIGAFFQLGEVAFAVLVIQMATPVAVSSYLFAEKYKADADAVAGLVLVSTLMSVGFLPLLLAIVI